METNAEFHFPFEIQYKQKLGAQLSSLFLWVVGAKTF